MTSKNLSYATGIFGYFKNLGLTCFDVYEIDQYIDHNMNIDIVFLQFLISKLLIFATFLFSY